jgi:hypothetical protein
MDVTLFQLDEYRILFLRRWSTALFKVKAGIDGLFTPKFRSKYKQRGHSINKSILDLLNLFFLALLDIIVSMQASEVSVNEFFLKMSFYIPKNGEGE